ncbi:hypothetical protein LCGC14_0215150 [marine sediment metagenome]|uniref:Uncharacterized protein n=1 Tax=marine sediment metagenome TaxID=412755 RepID=A0A0F9UJL5_9ZZZZ
MGLVRRLRRALVYTKLVEGFPLLDAFRTIDWGKIKERLRDLEPLMGIYLTPLAGRR